MRARPLAGLNYIPGLMAYGDVKDRARAPHDRAGEARSARHRGQHASVSTSRWPRRVPSQRTRLRSLRRGAGAKRPWKGSCGWCANRRRNTGRNESMARRETSMGSWRHESVCLDRRRPGGRPRTRCTSRDAARDVRRVVGHRSGCMRQLFNGVGIPMLDEACGGARPSERAGCIARRDTHAPEATSPGVDVGAAFADTPLGMLWWHSRSPSTRSRAVPGLLGLGNGARQALLPRRGDRRLLDHLFHAGTAPRASCSMSSADWALSDQPQWRYHGECSRRLSPDVTAVPPGWSAAIVLRTATKYNVKVGESLNAQRTVDDAVYGWDEAASTIPQPLYDTQRREEVNRAIVAACSSRTSASRSPSSPDS